jgi:large subunit ribosomal protein L28
MSRCELTGKGPVVKNLVSHSNIKTKSIAQPNVQKKRIFSKVLNQMVRLQVATSAIRDMEHMGGFDMFILNQEDKVLSKRALDVKNRIRRKMTTKKKAKASKAKA